MEKAVFTAFFCKGSYINKDFFVYISINEVLNFPNKYIKTSTSDRVKLLVKNDIPKRKITIGFGQYSKY